MQQQPTINWAILCTGWGRNATDVIQTHGKGKLGRSRIKLLIYEQIPCGAAEEAQKQGIETIQVQRNNFPTIGSYQDHILQLLKKREIDHVFLMNYKYRVREAMLLAFPNRIYNVHPSLFPSFLGTKTAIQDALEYGVKITGITTHIINHELDMGMILEQKAIKIKDNDNFDSLYPKFVRAGKKIIIKTINNVGEKYSG